ncbi:hypothetical protein [Sphingomonas xinjiangensis]|uniref:Methyl-accepting chemotaxis protein n=1 Tax=Sphingomonas xinjiangensis TaxID=643568 RepID=A0A840YJ06_9SPHN|nr:hypothetical protein [Sphingomonas xinjiangensis]MBB5712099.1 methyl-accepting chemotaxis protein [Sphingomonas xinjiangensis]
MAAVAGEIKSLAGDAARASERIAGLLTGIRDSVERVCEDIERTGEAVRDISEAAAGIPGG